MFKLFIHLFALLVASVAYAQISVDIAACYTTNITPTIKARFTVEPASITSAKIDAVSMNADSILPGFLATNIAFVNGVSVGDMNGYVTLTALAPTPSVLRKSVTIFQWRVHEIMGTAFTAPLPMGQSGPHTNYVIFAEPLPPWNNTFGHPLNAWTTALDFLFDKAGCNGKATAEEALAAITQYLHTGHGLTYDTSQGAAHYTQHRNGGVMNLTAYMNKTQGKPRLANGVVNCYDQAAAVCSFGTLLGISVGYKYMKPFGYINTINLIGVGDCNNPFFQWNNTPAVIPINSTRRTDFANHAFTMFNGYVFDACAGPALGKPLPLYLSDTIDASKPMGNTNNITTGVVTSLQ